MDQQIFNRKSISHKIMHPQSWKLQAKLIQIESDSIWISFACNFQDWGCVILREIDLLLKFADRFLAYTDHGKYILEQNCAINYIYITHKKTLDSHKKTLDEMKNTRSSGKTL